MDATSDQDTELKAACFELARSAKWARAPIDSEEIQSLSEEFFTIATSCLSEPLCIDIPLLTRAVHYLNQAHGTSGGDPAWFHNMLSVVVEVARPNSGLDERGQAFEGYARRDYGPLARAYRVISPAGTSQTASFQGELLRLRLRHQPVMQTRTRPAPPVSPSHMRSLGGKARARKLTKRQRSEIARRAPRRTAGGGELFD